MTAILESSGKLKYLNAEIDTVINAKGNRYVDLRAENHDNLVAFGYAMELKGWDRFVRVIYTIFCCCFGDGSIADMAREKLRPIMNALKSKDIELISISNPAQEKIEAAAESILPPTEPNTPVTPPPLETPKPVEIEPKKEALRAMALRYNNQDTVFKVELVPTPFGAPAFRITHSSTYHILQHTSTDSFTVPVSAYFSGTEFRSPRSVDYVKLLCDQMKKNVFEDRRQSRSRRYPDILQKKTIARSNRNKRDLGALKRELLSLLPIY
jgi:hypothetical protein